MKILNLLYIIVLFSNFASSNEALIESNLKNILPPDTTIESIEPSSLKGIYKVYYGDLQPIYVSEDGNFFIYGDMYKIGSNDITNLTKEEIKGRRSDILDSIPADELIIFKSNNELVSITVFTDVDCGYCRKLHSQIDEYNQAGITIKYAAFPRSGIGTQTFTKMVGAWCSEDPKQAMTDLKNDKKMNLDFCEEQPIARHYIIGQKLGINGTPAIITPDGDLIPGYVSPEELLSQIKI
jgi:thiol:disulfide interchange protein DsbC|tara:strand:+ start:1285 stop:1998 length:714 start_codon:yes stop_codon:yes gene_type:complete